MLKGAAKGPQSEFVDLTGEGDKLSSDVSKGKMAQQNGQMPQSKNNNLAKDHSKQKRLKQPKLFFEKAEVAAPTVPIIHHSNSYSYPAYNHPQTDYNHPAVSMTSYPHDPYNHSYYASNYQPYHPPNPGLPPVQSSVPIKLQTVSQVQSTAKVQQSVYPIARNNLTTQKPISSAAVVQVVSAHPLTNPASGIFQSSKVAAQNVGELNSAIVKPFNTENNSTFKHPAAPIQTSKSGKFQPAARPITSFQPARPKCYYEAVDDLNPDLAQHGFQRALPPLILMSKNNAVSPYQVQQLFGMYQALRTFAKPLLRWMKPMITFGSSNLKIEAFVSYFRDPLGHLSNLLSWYQHLLQFNRVASQSDFADDIDVMETDPEILIHSNLAYHFTHISESISERLEQIEFSDIPISLHITVFGSLIDEMCDYKSFKTYMDSIKDNHLDLKESVEYAKKIIFDSQNELNELTRKRNALKTQSVAKAGSLSPERTAIVPLDNNMSEAMADINHRIEKVDARLAQFASDRNQKQSEISLLLGINNRQGYFFVFYGRECFLGNDRNGLAYWFIPVQPNKAAAQIIYGIVANDPSDKFKWFTFKDLDTVVDFYQSLCTQGLRESKLRVSLMKCHEKFGVVLFQSIETIKALEVYPNVNNAYLEFNKWLLDPVIPTVGRKELLAKYAKPVETRVCEILRLGESSSEHIMTLCEKMAGLHDVEGFKRVIVDDFIKIGLIPTTPKEYLSLETVFTLSHLYEWCSGIISRINREIRQDARDDIIIEKRSKVKAAICITRKTTLNEEAKDIVTSRSGRRVALPTNWSKVIVPGADFESEPAQGKVRISKTVVSQESGEESSDSEVLPISRTRGSRKSSKIAMQDDDKTTGNRDGRTSSIILMQSDGKTTRTRNGRKSSIISITEDDNTTRARGGRKSSMISIKDSEPTDSNSEGSGSGDDNTETSRVSIVIPAKRPGKSARRESIQVISDSEESEGEEVDCVNRYKSSTSVDSVPLQRDNVSRELKKRRVVVVVSSEFEKDGASSEDDLLGN